MARTFPRLAAALLAVALAAPSPTPVAAADPTVPDPPTGVTAEVAPEMANVSWTAPLNDGGAEITAYTVTASPGGQTCATTGATSCVVRWLPNGVAVTFTVTATNAIGTSASSEPSNPVTPATVPDRPTSVYAIPGDAEAEVRWAQPPSDGGSPITGYEVTSSPAGGTCSTTERTCIVTGLRNETAYQFTVRARNAVGPGAWSVPSSGVTPVALAHPLITLRAAEDETPQRAIAMSSDGTTIATLGGSLREGVLVWERTGPDWSGMTTPAVSLTTDDWYLQSIAMDEEGRTIAAGTGGSVHVWERTGPSWRDAVERTVIAAPEGASLYFGYSIALSGDGSTLLVRAFGAVAPGEVWAIRRGADWSSATSRRLEAPWQLTTDVGFGEALALTHDGREAFVGAPGEDTPTTQDSGAVYVYGLDATAATRPIRLGSSEPWSFEALGTSILPVGDGSTLLVGSLRPYCDPAADRGCASTRPGALYVFREGVEGWGSIPAARHDPPSSWLGFTAGMHLAADGVTLVATADDWQGYAIGVVSASGGDWIRPPVFSWQARIAPYVRGYPHRLAAVSDGRLMAILDDGLQVGIHPIEAPARPTPPGSITATSFRGALVVSWAPSHTPWYLPVIRYTATAHLLDFYRTAVASCRTDGTSCTITGLTEGTRYGVSVVATNRVGDAGDWNWNDVLVDATSPQVSGLTATIEKTTLGASSLPVRLTWNVSGYTWQESIRVVLERSTDGTTWTTLTTYRLGGGGGGGVGGGTAPGLLTSASTSGTTTFRVIATDQSGNISPPATVTVSPQVVQQTASGISYTGTWTTTRGTTYSGGSVRYARLTGSASYRFTGRTIALVTTFGPDRGVFRVYIDGRYTFYLDMRAATRSYRRIAWQKTWATSGTHTITLVAVGTSSRPRIDLDAFVVLR